MILIIDNYDSFTYNLYQFVGSINRAVTVRRNDALTVAEVKQLAPSHIIISPGPGQPKDAGICEELLVALAGQVPILGVCLGHQAIGEAFGGKVVLAPQLMHGKQSLIKLQTDNAIFAGLAPTIKAARYHSLIVDSATLPAKLLSIAETEDGLLMGVKHQDYNIFGVQFHPESIMTPEGLQIIKNFLKIKGGK